MVLADVILLTLTVRLELRREMRDKLDWIENDEADVFLRSSRIRLAGDMMFIAVGVQKAFGVLLMVVDVDIPMDFLFSSNSLFLIFSLMALSSCVLFGVFSGWFD